MKKIGLLSDTHNYLDPSIPDYFKECDEIWHAGDFGTLTIADQLREIAPVFGVYGNIDGQDIRQEFPLVLRREVEGVDFFMTHIGGHPGRYALPVHPQLKSDTPDVFICGHSHILKIVRDRALNNMLYLNPGAAGRHGFQLYRTIVRFDVDNGKLKNMDVVNLSDSKG
ncbi:MAG: metallophosphoesterase family protein [Bacteroidetes bacterium]|nr:metallophosphoesterase family protein [Bacteroidota bacterium]MCH8523253.1 metallophosphatase family protein [Balneolales bacterium]